MKQYPTKFLLAFLVMLFAVSNLSAQTMSVASFEAVTSDMSAMQHGTKELDANGDPCAIIKIQTSEKGFTFDVGSLGVVKTQEKVGEIWVYVPFGVKKITLHHPTLKPITYNIPVSVEKGRVYKMDLTTDDVLVIRKQKVTQQFVVFNLTPKNAMVELDGNLIETSDGIASKRMNFGTYNYKVQAPNYYTQTGTVTVNDAKQKKVVDIVLKSSKSSITVNAENNAEIWVNGEKKGTGSWTGSVGAGAYTFEAKLAGYRSTSQSVTIGESETKTITLQAPIPMYGSLAIESKPGGAKVTIDGKDYGETPLMLDEILAGTHKVELSKDNYQSVSANVTVVENQTFDYSATLKAGRSNASFSSSGSNAITITAKGVSFDMILVKAGTFTMGATSEQQNPDDDEKPTHRVTLTNDYYIGKTEVTQELWQAVMGSNPSHFRGTKKPVEQVSWNDCQTFISKLNSLTGKRFRLPTEAEWEFAARGGNNSKGYQYSGSAKIDDVAWYTVNCYDKGSSSPDYGTHDVATKQPNELGIYDMSGNVWEWCQDWYDSYSSSSQTNPTGASNGSGRVCRGGCWSINAGRCRSANRYDGSPDIRDYYLGFRLVFSE